MEKENHWSAGYFHAKKKKILIGTHVSIHMKN
jgi:hypothetical protein